MKYEVNPNKFNANIDVVGCIVEAKGEFVLLKRKKSLSHGGKWGIPSGKVEKGETPLNAIKREISEEINFDANESSFLFVKAYNVRYFLKEDFRYHLFHLKLEKKISITLGDEHTILRWSSPRKALRMNLVPGTELSIKEFFNIN